MGEDRAASPLWFVFLNFWVSPALNPTVLPYMQQAGYLASVYLQVYLDFGLAIPFLSVSGMRETIRQLLELTPTTKLMYSSDAHSIPELYYLGAKWGRQLLK
ncbi:hypothetical protein PQG02_26700 [Nostoc sp. UHCC 0926]|uniref:hypothetical protein n=1 Tax=unclassified Nostoc TaxID=2593658 RepID=UPI00235E5443|nr:hypothetical protein [Nostoc sp. UHCC 0926]WDD32219.1 hypothetical protein PQG02_26700 [Nostoc sp. UHCC 0926]